MSSITYTALPNLPTAARIAACSERPEVHLIWFPPTGGRGDRNVFRCESTPAGERITHLAETMYGVRGGADHALV